MRVIITGSEDNVGKKLMTYLQDKGYEVFGIGTTTRIANDYRMADINNSIELSEVFNTFRPDVCYHLAAKVSRVTCEKSPSLAVKTNVMGTNNVIQLCKYYKVRLIYFSTSEVYGDISGLHTEDRELKPNNIYGLSKLIGEQLVQYNITCGLDAIIVRPFMLYHESEQTGEHHSALIRFCDGLTRRQKITVHLGTSRSWMYIGDAIQIFEKLLHTKGNHTLNVGNPDIYSISKLAQMICDKLGIDYNEYVKEVPMPERTSHTKELDLTRQAELTGFSNFTSLSEGLDRVLNKMLCK
jgi:nucleoside-diphosphate-sugar epimerase